MDERERAEKIIASLETAYPYEEGTILHWKTPLELLVATILSAQSTDEQINKLTPALFKRYKTAKDYADANIDELELYIRSSGFYHRKAELIQTACRQIVADYGGEVPRTMEDLLTLKGVARKTANIVLGNAYGVVEGIAVDTHVMRLSQRLRWSGETDRDKIEQDLLRLIPYDKWYEVNYLLITHGRRICDAKKPDCGGCVINKLCPSAFTFKHNKPN
ncbi:MAG: endonuclease III [Candidatus Bathyarchaeota archaeon]|nr:endonuclease III [Candidatus Bathyarchaeota archaeon]